MSAPEEEKAPKRVEMYLAANARGVMTSGVRLHRETAERDVAENTVTFPQYAPHRLVLLVELREGDLFVRAEAMEAVMEKMEQWLLTAEGELHYYDEAWDDLIHSRDASARATNRHDLEECRSMLLGTIRSALEFLPQPRKTP